MKWYAYDPNYGLELYHTAKEAKAAAEEFLEWNRDAALSGEEWHEGVSELQWGKLEPVEVAKIKEHPAPEGSNYNCVWDVSLRRLGNGELP